MEATHYKAIRAHETAPGKFEQRIETLSVGDLPDNEVMIRVHYSSLNYKDALSATGHKGVTKNYPHTPGTDAAGEVVKSRSEQWKAGDQVIVTGYDLGMNTAGGFGAYISVPSSWIVPMPAGLTLKESMMLGTAGFTAALGLDKLRTNGQEPEQVPVLVTGATGGVGSISLMLLKKAGYKTCAATGKTDKHEYLRSLGADMIIEREALTDVTSKPLLKEEWAAAIETGGGTILSSVLRSCRMHGHVVTCGNASSAELNMTLMPFILRGISLLGVTASNTPMEKRRHLWERLATTWKPEGLNEICRICSPEEVPAYIRAMLAGKLSGRVVIDMINGS